MLERKLLLMLLSDMSLLLIVLALLNGLDYATTKFALEKGIGFEGNPISAWYMAIGIYDVVKPSFSVVLCLFAIILEIRGVTLSSRKEYLVAYIASIITLATVVFYIFVVLNNVFVIFWR